MLDRPSISYPRIQSLNTCKICGAGGGFCSCRREECPNRAANAPGISVSEIVPQGRSRVIVVGNEKGGSGKSTIAMHLIVALIKRGFRVASIDLDASQGTLSRYIECRRAFAERSGIRLDLPEHRCLHRSDEVVRTAAERAEHATLQTALGELAGRDFIVIDTPGSDSFLSWLAHGCADILITPLNDSLLDLDLLARIDVENLKVLGNGRYSQMVLERRQARALADQRALDWIVVRNRMTHIDARNKQEIGCLLEQLSQRLEFRLMPGFGERVIFRELFLKGLTLLDLCEDAPDTRLTMSHVAARQEVRALVQAIGLPSDKQAIVLPFESKADSKKIQSINGNIAPIADSVEVLGLEDILY